MLEKLRKSLYSDNGVSPEHRIILAVSGGIDSMVMSELFSRLDNELIVAHCNFSLRGEESDKDEEFVKNFCGERSIPFISKRFDTLAYARENRISVQMAARDLRYNWFHELRLEKDFNFIATAHNLNDQIETFFINLSRGTGIRGLTGISHKNGVLIRPLSHFTRKEIVEFAEKHSVDWREDSSNISTRYIRNKFRHQILPLIEELNPSFERTMEENINNLSKVQSIYLKYIDERKEYIVRRTGKQFIINIELLLNEEFGQSVIYEILSDLNFSPTAINDIWQSLWSPPGKRFYSDSHRIIKDRDELIIEAWKPSEEKKFYIDKDQNEVDIPVKLSIEYIENKNFKIPPYPDIACIDADKTDFPLIIRKWYPGDYFHPLGMQNSKKLSDFFVDNKFSIPMKEKTWLLCSGQDIIWIIGYRIDDRYKITRDTRKIMKIQIMD
ncbi:MAG: tRNA lysidine(34) synthetase TilS [Bacteroidota bacterium]